MISNVQIVPALAKGNLIQWTLEPNSNTDNVVEIFKSYDSLTWDKIGTTTNGFFFVDSNINMKETRNPYYRLVLNNEHQFTTSTFLASLPKKDRATIKALRRKEVLLQDKGGGRPGFLLKRREYGPCLSCSGEEGNTTCDECHGTGFFGGFYRPVEYNVISVSSQLSKKKQTSPIGTYNKEQEVTRGLVYPELREGDVWVEKFTDRRFYITGVTEVQYRGIPIIYSNIEMRLVPVGSVIYKIEVR